MSEDSSAAPNPVLRLDFTGRVNLAFQQNNLPVLRRLELRNETPHAWNDVQIRLTAQPAWAADLTLRVAQIPAATDYPLSDLPLPLHLDYLANLSERVRGALHIEVTAAAQTDAGEESNDNTERPVLFSGEFPIEVYAPDEWTGLVTLPEILAAFVTPNLETIEHLLARTTDFLKERTGDSALNGYQAKSRKRVYEILAAIDAAIRACGIRYSHPPASFETSGQRVRFAPRILEHRLGTCLDLCLLYASVIEAAGLHPLITLVEGHAFPGCWLIGETLTEPSCDDLQSLRKRVELDEILLFESTLACEGNGGSFEHAVATVAPRLLDDRAFREVIDIRRARISGIRPLPLERSGNGLRPTEPPPAVLPGPSASAPPPPAGERAFIDDLAPADTAPPPAADTTDRVSRWRQQLLDLTLRNRLLNFRETRQTLPLACPQPESLEDELAAAKQFKVLPQSKLMSGTDPRDFALRQRETGEDPLLAHLREEFAARRLRSFLPEKDLAGRIIELYRRVRTEEEESGANTLFLALGFLEWREERDAKSPHRAPLLLIPVRLERASVQHGFTLRRHDEEAQVNVTLLELLRRDFALEVPGVHPPPEGESGVDVARVFRLFQQAVRDMPGWEVKREVWLAQFSFAKFLLWKDLGDRLDDLTRNPVVNHLINHPGEPFPDPLETLSESELDDRVPVAETFCPVSADSSQLTAIVAADTGKSFVLHGPPGTGKSQTITNLIAHLLARGKSVLFVAEKRAALEVVHRRLTQIGLAPFCLELHSSKSGKAEVLRQIGEAMDFVESRAAEDWSTEAARLEAARNDLNAYVRALHERHPNGLSAYQAYAWLIAHRRRHPAPEEPPALDLADLTTHTAEEYQSLERLCEDLRLRGGTNRLSPEAHTHLRPIRACSWTPDTEDEAVAATRELLQALTAFTEAAPLIAEHLAPPPADTPYAFWCEAVALLHALLDTPALPAAFAEGGDWKGFRTCADTVLEAGRRRDEARAQLDGFDLAKVLALDLAPLRAAHERFSKGGFFERIRLWIQLKPIRAARLPKAPRFRNQEAAAFLQTATVLQETHALIEKNAPHMAARLGLQWKGGEDDWAALENLLQWGDTLHGHILQLAGEDPRRLGEIRAAVARLLAAADLLANGSPLHTRIADLTTRWEDLNARFAAFTETLRVDAAALPPGGWLDQGRGLADHFLAHRRDFQSWCRWQESRQEAERLGLAPLLHLFDDGHLALDDLRPTFEHAYRHQFVRHLIQRSPTLREFWGDEHADRIHRFNTLDAAFTRLTARAVAARLAAQLPGARRENCPPASEIGILQRERTKKRGHLPVRRLLADTPHVTARLKPCFLMSPLSVAQYLDAGREPFDLVVFDEASQIPVWDAIGAIARGRQAVIVGDPRQLPPTNFFGRVESDEDAIDDGSITDLESILDECLGSGLSTYYLRWHYRSRREGLIAFSNHHYYDNRLLTFPAPQADCPGIRCVPVPHGHYDKGKSRTNAAEAEAIVAEVIARLRDPARARASIGIVTFSQAQQTLILDLLDKARSEHPEIESGFSDDQPEPVFVKNLENVQGDERDVIFFSVCYGPDLAGRVSMNFGPLNRAGGERRLNVAVTRARREIVVFSTLRPDQIDLSRTRAKGVEHLKAYLEYAERGPRALAAALQTAHTDAFDSLFESEVAAFLREQGYDVHTQVGCSGYRIDLAVVAPGHPGRYLLGIECDGATYHRTATARDRDRLRQSVLEGLGWKIHRIWSTDWWRDFDKAAALLLERIREEADAFSPDADDLPPPPPPVEPEPPPPDPPAAEAPPPPRTTPRALYPAPEPQPHSPPEAFYLPETRRRIRRQMERIIAHEGPLLESVLFQRVCAEWGFKSLGKRIRAILEECAPTAPPPPAGSPEPLHWPPDITPETYTAYRVPAEDAPLKRKIDEIPLPEVQNALLDLIGHYLSCPREDLLRETVKLFGGQMLTGKAAETVGAALDQLVLENRIHCEKNTCRAIL